MANLITTLAVYPLLYWVLLVHLFILVLAGAKCWQGHMTLRELVVTLVVGTPYLALFIVPRAVYTIVRRTLSR